MDVRVAQLYVVDYAFIVLAFGLGGVVPPQHSSHRRQRAIAGLVASTCYLYLARTGSPRCSVQRLEKSKACAPAMEKKAAWYSSARSVGLTPGLDS